MNLKLHSSKIHSYRYFFLAAFLFFMMASFSFLSMQGMKSTSAVSAAGFKPGNIMSDAVMANYNTMSVDDIQRFLTSKNPCNDRDYNKYLRLKSSYPNNDWRFENGHFICLSEERFGDGETLGRGQTAAEIIYQAAQTYRINPQVLLVLLQKEQGLITDTYPNKVQYRAATGFGCPDTAPCSEKYYGLKNQINQAASLFRSVLDGGWSNYPAYKTVYVKYNPNANCGGTNVYIENRATSALYRYTPYQPNSSALNAGYGTGDVCGAYGNRNFYLYFSDWFGSPHISIDGHTADIVEGIYSIAPKTDTKQSLEVHNASTKNGSNAQLWERRSSNSHQWQVKRESNGYYVIKNVHSGLVLDVSGGLTSNGTNIQTYSYNGTCAQQWKIHNTPDGYYTLESACAPAMVLDMAGGIIGSGTNVQLYIANNSNAQKWSFVLGETIASGTYIVESHENRQFVMDVAGGSKSSGASTQVYSGNKTIAQKWHLEYHSSGDYYTISNPVSGKVLDVDAGILKSGSKLQMYNSNSTCAQRWKIFDTRSGYVIMSACAMDQVINPTDNRITNDSKLRLSSYNASVKSQRWEFTKPSVIDDKTYTLSSDLSSTNKPYVIDVSGDGVHNGTNIQVWSYDSKTTAQQWELKYDASSDTYEFINPKSHKTLDVAGASMRNSANINLYSKNSTCAQKWHILEDGAGKYLVLSSCNPQYGLDVSGGIVGNGTNLQLYLHNSTASQKWRLIQR